MRWDHANIFLKILEEPPETATLILLTTNPYSLLSTIRSRCVQFFFARCEQESGRADSARARADLPAAHRKLAAQLAEGSPGDALTLESDGSDRAEAHRSCGFWRRPSRAVPPSDLFAQTTQLAKGQKVPFETVLELFYSLLTDLLELSAGFAGQGFAIRASARRLATLSRRVDPAWVAQAVEGLDELGGRLRRNINRQLGLDAVAMSLVGSTDQKDVKAGSCRLSRNSRDVACIIDQRVATIFIGYRSSEIIEGASDGKSQIIPSLL